MPGEDFLNDLRYFHILHIRQGRLYSSNKLRKIVCLLLLRSLQSTRFGQMYFVAQPDGSPLLARSGFWVIASGACCSGGDGMEEGKEQQAQTRRKLAALYLPHRIASQENLTQADALTSCITSSTGIVSATSNTPPVFSSLREVNG